MNQKGLWLFILFALLSMNLYPQSRLKRFVIEQKPTPGFIVYVDHPDCAVIIVNSAIPGLFFESNMARIKEQSYSELESRYKIFIYPEKQIITVKASGFLEAQLPIFSNLSAKQTFVFQINEALETLGKGSLSLSSEPSGASIQMEGIPTGGIKTPHTFDDLLAMQHQVTLSSYRYQDTTFVAIVKRNQDVQINTRMRPAWVELSIETEPKGSSVYLNEIYRGITPITFQGIEYGLDAGTYQLKIVPMSAHREPIIRELKLNPGAKEFFRLQHRDNSGLVRIVPTHTPCNVYVNGTLDTSLSDLRDRRLSVVVYDFRAVYTGPHSKAFSPFERRVQIESGDEISIPVKFNPRQQALALKANVSDYTIHLFDTETGLTTRYSDPESIPPLFAGNYSITATKHGYKDWKQDIEINHTDVFLDINFEAYSANYPRRIALWRASKYTSGTALLAALGATAYYGLSAFQNYSDYKNTSSSVDATQYKQDAIDARNMAFTCAGIDVVGGLWLYYSFVRQRHWQEVMERESRGGK